MHFFLILFLLCYQLFGLSDLNHNSVMTAARKLAPNIQNKFELEEIRDHFIEISNSAEYKKAHIIWRFMASLLMTGTQGTLDLYQKILDSGYRRDQSLLKEIGFSWGGVAMNKVENHILEVSNRLRSLKGTNQNVCSPQDMDYLKKIMGVVEGWQVVSPLAQVMLIPKKWTDEVWEVFSNGLSEKAKGLWGQPHSESIGVGNTNPLIAELNKKPPSFVGGFTTPVLSFPNQSGHGLILSVDLGVDQSVVYGGGAADHEKWSDELNEELAGYFSHPHTITNWRHGKACSIWQRTKESPYMRNRHVVCLNPAYMLFSWFEGWKGYDNKTRYNMVGIALMSSEVFGVSDERGTVDYLNKSQVNHTQTESLPVDFREHSNYRLISLADLPQVLSSKAPILYDVRVKPYGLSHGKTANFFKALTGKTWPRCE